MTTRVYPVFRGGLVGGSLGDLATATWKVSLCDGTAVYDDDDETLSDVSGVLVTATVPVSYGDGGFDGDSVDVSGLVDGDVVRAVVVTVGATLVAWCDVTSDGMPMRLVATGDPVTVSWPVGLLEMVAS